MTMVDYEKLARHLCLRSSEDDQVRLRATEWQIRIRKILGPVHVSWGLALDLARVDLALEEMEQ